MIDCDQTHSCSFSLLQGNILPTRVSDHQNEPDVWLPAVGGRFCPPGCCSRFKYWDRSPRQFYIKPCFNKIILLQITVESVMRWRGDLFIYFQWTSPRLKKNISVNLSFTPDSDSVSPNIISFSCTKVFAVAAAGKGDAFSTKQRLRQGSAVQVYRAVCDWTANKWMCGLWNHEWRGKTLIALMWKTQSRS